MLQQALGDLLDQRPLEEVSVADIAEAATLNRATFYDHYPDKFALLEAMVAARFQQLLMRREVVFDGGCASVVGSIALAMCEFLAETPNLACRTHRQMEQQFESAMVAVVRGMLVDGIARHPPSSGAAPSVVAAALAGALYGAAKEWIRTPGRGPVDQAALWMYKLVAPMLA